MSDQIGNITSTTVIVEQSDVGAANGVAGLDATGKLAQPVESSTVDVPNDGVTTHMVNVEQMMNHLWSAASLNGFALTDNLNGTVDIAQGDVLLRPTNTHDSQLKSYQIAATVALALVDNDQNFIYASYNGGSPILATTTDPTAIDGRTETPIFVVTRVGTTIHYVDIRTYTTDFMHAQTRKEFFTQGYVHEPGGSLIAATGTRNLALTAGAFYLVDKRIPHIGFDTAVADTFTRYSTADSGATWTRTTGQTQVENTQYNDITTGLVTLANNKYKVAWVYLILNDTDIFALVEGQAEYDNAAAADLAKAPSVLPPEVQPYSTGILVGKVIIEKSASAFFDLQTPFGDILIGSAPSASTLDDLTDVTITTPVTDDVIIYNGSQFVNSPSSNNAAAGTLSTWVLDAGTIYYQDLTHNLNSDDVLVEIYDSVTKETVLVEKIDRINLNTVRVYIEGNTASLRVVVTNAILSVQGSSGRNVVLNPTSPYLAQNNDIIIWDCTTGNKVVDLPPEATSANFRIDVKKIDPTANTITIDPDGAELIEGGSAAVMTTQYEALSIVPGGGWWILAAV